MGDHQGRFNQCWYHLGAGGPEGWGGGVSGCQCTHTHLDLQLPLERFTPSVLPGLFSQFHRGTTQVKQLLVGRRVKCSSQSKASQSGGHLVEYEAEPAVHESDQPGATVLGRAPPGGRFNDSAWVRKTRRVPPTGFELKNCLEDRSGWVSSKPENGSNS